MMNILLFSKICRIVKDNRGAFYELKNRLLNILSHLDVIWNSPNLFGRFSKALIFLEYTQSIS